MGAENDLFWKKYRDSRNLKVRRLVNSLRHDISVVSNHDFVYSRTSCFHVGCMSTERRVGYQHTAILAIFEVEIRLCFMASLFAESDMLLLSLSPEVSCLRRRQGRIRQIIANIDQNSILAWDLNQLFKKIQERCHLPLIKFWNGKCVLFCINIVFP